jgi:hypothetical protein
MPMTTVARAPSMAYRDPHALHAYTLVTSANIDYAESSRLWGTALRIVISILCAAFLAGCSGEDMPPSGFEPAAGVGEEKGPCPDLIGDYELKHHDDALQLFPNETPAAFAEMSYLSIEPGIGTSRYRAVFRPMPGRLDLAAMELRMQAPARYMRWRELVLQDDGPIAGREAAIAEIGPAVGIARDIEGSCRSGWSSIGSAQRVKPPFDPDRGPPPPTYVGTSISRSVRGDLLIKRSVSETKSTGFSFFGQTFTYQTHAYTTWHRLPLAPAGSARAKLDANTLPTVLTDAQWSAMKAERDDAFLVVEQHLRRYIANRTRISVLRPVQFDPSALSLPPGTMRIEFGGDYSGERADNPFVAAMRTQVGVSEIELRREELRPDGRKQTLVNALYRFAPAPSLR